MPITVLRKSPVDLRESFAARDPFMAALEARYAQQVADAQTRVNESVVDDPNNAIGRSKFVPAAYGNLRVGGGDIVFGSARQSAAKMARNKAITDAAKEYNRGLKPLDPRRKSIVGNPFYGA